MPIFLPGTVHLLGNPLNPTKALGLSLNVCMYCLILLCPVLVYDAGCAVVSNGLPTWQETEPIP